MRSGHRNNHAQMVFGERPQWDTKGVYTPNNLVVVFRERRVTGKQHIDEQVRWNAFLFVG